ncbi:hypothetical protein [Natrinema sp. 1APR25-10V2]|uniref:DUF7520 family protein n=1 Tax=Natrinema sp. 1APR25-10V2 TaxID=2951081 RepID=UPI00287B76CB|nr:hypothetical protein [Natrinema sp. 1APR25-10V2]
MSLGLALVAATAAFGALLGATLPTQMGVNEITLFTIAVPVSPLTLAAYGAVAMGIALTTAGLVVHAVSRRVDTRDGDTA